MLVIYFDDIAKMTDSLCLYRIGRLSIEFESKQNILKAAGSFLPYLRGAEKQTDYRLGAAAREKTSRAVEV